MKNTISTQTALNAINENHIAQTQRSIELETLLKVESLKLAECLNYIKYAAAFIDSHGGDLNAQMVQSKLPLFALHEFTK